MLKTMQFNENAFHQNLSFDELLKIAIARNEGKIADNGALTVITGFRTGRSPKRIEFFRSIRF